MYLKRLFLFKKSTYPLHSRLSILWIKSKERNTAASENITGVSGRKHKKTTKSVKYNLISLNKLTSSC